MVARFGLISSFMFVMMFGVTEIASAAAGPVVTVSNWNYVAANPKSVPANMPTINPNGTYSLPAPAKGVQQNWKVLLDYGTLLNGNFTPFPPANQPGTGLTANLTITNLNNNGTYSFGGAPGDTLTVTANNLPANTAARIRLQLQVNGQWQDQGAPVYLALN